MSGLVARRAVPVVDDPVLGPCKVLPLRRDWGVLFAFLLLAMSVAGLLFLWLWVSGSPVDVDLELGVGLALCGLAGPPALCGLVWTLRAPYFAMVGPNGFAAMRSGGIPWAEVEAAGTTEFRGKRTRLILRLRNPRKLSQTERFMNLYGLLQDREAAYEVGLPLALAPLPADDVVAIFKAYLTAYEKDHPGVEPGAGEAED